MESPPAGRNDNVRSLWPVFSSVMSLSPKLRTYLPNTRPGRIFLAQTIGVIFIMSLLSPVISPIVSSGLHTAQCVSTGCEPTIHQEVVSARLSDTLRRGGVLISALAQTTIFNADRNWFGSLEGSIRPLGNLSDTIHYSHLPSHIKDPLQLSTSYAQWNLTLVRTHLTIVKHVYSSALISSIIEFESLDRFLHPLSETSSRKEWLQFQRRALAAVDDLLARISSLLEVLYQARRSCGDAGEAFHLFYEEIMLAQRIVNGRKKYDHLKLAYRLRCLFSPQCEHVKADLAFLDDGAPLVKRIKEDLDRSIERVGDFAHFAGYVKTGPDGYHAGPELLPWLQSVRFHDIVNTMKNIRLSIEGGIQTGV